MALVRSILYFAFGVGFAFAGFSESRFSAGPIFDDFQLTLAPGHRLEVLGPLYYHEKKESQSQWAVPPLFSWTIDPDVESEEFDFLYPFLTYDRFGREYRFQ